jgi:UDP-4-amino-4,6-dideoxy-N-acetyl-beta-L-altrosamine N-acetyltransferase
MSLLKMLNSNKVILKGVEELDLESLRNWRNNPSLRKYFREHKDITKIDQSNWYKKILSDKNQYNFSIFAENNLIGHCGLYYINWINRSAEFGIYIGNNNYRNGGYGSDALRTLIKYGFNDLNLNKIWCEVYKNNEALHVYKHIGFKHEGTLRDNYYNEGRYWDSDILSMLKKEYEQK